MILCECGEFIEGNTFKDYIKTSSNPSTPTIGHKECGLIYNFVDDGIPKRYFSKVELKQIAMKFAERVQLNEDVIGKFLLEVDRLKSQGTIYDIDILFAAYRIVWNEDELDNGINIFVKDKQ